MQHDHTHAGNALGGIPQSPAPQNAGMVGPLMAEMARRERRCRAAGVARRSAVLLGAVVLGALIATIAARAPAHIAAAVLDAQTPAPGAR